MSALDLAASQLYLAFQKYPLRNDIDFCPCCEGPESTEVLHRRPLRELEADDLIQYVMSAMWTIGDVDDFRHFLPRILELLLTEDFVAGIDQEFVIGKLRYARWTDWPEEERGAVRQFLRCLWAYARAQACDPYPNVPAEIDSWLCAIARAEPDLSPYLDDWKNDNTSASRANLERFIADVRQGIAGRPANPWWEDSPAQWNQVRDWLGR